MREKNRKPIASYIKLPQFTTMNVIDGQAGLIIYASLIFYSLTIDNILNIIVLLILAGVAIATLTGDNGLLFKTGQAKIEMEKSGEKELIQISTIQAMSNSENNNLEEDKLKEALNQNVGANKTTAIKTGKNFVIVFEESKRAYTIDENGSFITDTIATIDELAGDITKNNKNNGSSEAPYEINSIEDLVYFSKAINNREIVSNSYVILTDTLDFNSVNSYKNYKAKYKYDETTNAYIEDENSNISLIELCTTGQGFIPIEGFNGNFDGKKNEIQNIYIYREGNAGLFSNLTSSLTTIKNLGISGEITSTQNDAAGIAASGHLKAINCFNKANIYSGHSAGGIIGNCGWTGEIEYCYNTGKIAGKYRVGGIAGTFSGKMENCYNTASVIKDASGSTGVAGILGCSGESNIINCYNTGDITANGGWTWTSGIVGENYGNSSIVNNCYNIGNVTTNYETAFYCKTTCGIGGNQNNNCYNLGKLKSSNNNNYEISSNIINKCYYSSNTNKDVEVKDEENAIDIADKSAQQLVDLLNSYKDETGEYPSEWKQWTLGENGYPVFNN